MRSSTPNAFPTTRWLTAPYRAVAFPFRVRPDLTAPSGAPPPHPANRKFGAADRTPHMRDQEDIREVGRQGQRLSIGNITTQHSNRNTCFAWPRQTDGSLCPSATRNDDSSTHPATFYRNTSPVPQRN